MANIYCVTARFALVKSEGMDGYDHECKTKS